MCPDDSKAAREPGVAVIGGGPAGLTAAEVLAEAGLAVTLYDRMPSLGRKLLIAGRGGLNLTHGEPLPAFLGRYNPLPAPLRAAIEAYPPDRLRAWCEGLGQPTFVGSSGRVFPESFKASPLLREWLARLAQLGVAVRTRHRLVGIGADSLVFERPEGRLTVRPLACLLALGGASWPRLGSDGGWVALLEGQGVAVAPLEPSNVGFAVVWSDLFSARFAGMPLKRIGLSIGSQRVRGEAVVTRDGIEGGAVYALSRPLREAIRRDGTAVLSVDLRPDLGMQALAQRLSRRSPGSTLATHLRKAAGLSPVAAGLLREAHGLGLPSAAEALAAAIKDAPLRLVAPGPLARAISTAGGVPFAALDERFMLGARPGLFLAGEMLDWEAPTGGYLLQGAFATGRAAAYGMIHWLRTTATPEH